MGIDEGECLPAESPPQKQDPLSPLSPLIHPHSSHLQLRNSGLTATGSSPMTALSTGSTPLQASLQRLDLGDNAGLAWLEPAQTIFAATATSGYVSLFEL